MSRTKQSSHRSTTRGFAEGVSAIVHTSKILGHGDLIISKVLIFLRRQKIRTVSCRYETGGMRAAKNCHGFLL